MFLTDKWGILVLIFVKQFAPNFFKWQTNQVKCTYDAFKSKNFPTFYFAIKSTKSAIFSEINKDF